VGRVLTLLSILVVLAAPVVAQEAPDCAMWELKGIRPGMTLEEASTHRVFNEFRKFRDQLGYSRFIWQASDRPEKIDLHVEIGDQSFHVVGVMTTIPSTEVPPRQYLARLLEKWGEPDKVTKQGAFSLYTWTDQACDVDARATVMNQHHEVGVFAAVASISGRAEVVRRKREANARAEAEAEVAPPTAPAPDPGEGGDD